MSRAAADLGVVQSALSQQISRLEGCVHQFNHAPTAAVRRRVLTGFFAAVALSAVLIAFFGKLAWAFGVVGLMAQDAVLVLDR